MYWKRPKMSVLPYLLVFFSDTELLFDSEFWLKPKYRYCYNHRHPQAVVNVEFAKCKHRGLTCALFAH